MDCYPNTCSTVILGNLMFPEVTGKDSGSPVSLAVISLRFIARRRACRREGVVVLGTSPKQRPSPFHYLPRARSLKARRSTSVLFRSQREINNPVAARPSSPARNRRTNPIHRTSPDTVPVNSRARPKKTSAPASATPLTILGPLEKSPRRNGGRLSTSGRAVDYSS